MASDPHPQQLAWSPGLPCVLGLEMGFLWIHLSFENSQELASQPRGGGSGKCPQRLLSISACQMLGGDLDRPLQENRELCVECQEASVKLLKPAFKGSKLTM